MCIHILSVLSSGLYQKCPCENDLQVNGRICLPKLAHHLFIALMRTSRFSPFVTHDPWVYCCFHSFALKLAVLGALQNGACINNQPHIYWTSVTYNFFTRYWEVQRNTVYGSCPHGTHSSWVKSPKYHLNSWPCKFKHTLSGEAIKRISEARKFPRCVLQSGSLGVCGRWSVRGGW